MNAFFVWVIVLPSAAFHTFELSPQLADAQKQAITQQCPALAPATTGYREPSLVFLTSTDLAMTDGKGAAEFLTAAKCRIAFVEKAQEAAFLAALPSQKAAQPVKRITGINLNGGKALDIGVYVRQDDAP